MPASRAQQTATAKRRSQALAMRLAGATFEKIAQTLGYANRGAAQKDVSRALDTARREMSQNAEELRAVEIMRLDRLQAGLWTVALAGDHKAVDTLLRLMDRRSKLLGLDRATAPTEGAKSLLGDLARGLAHLADELDETEGSGLEPEPADAP